jgi:hypothetical protein
MKRKVNVIGNGDIEHDTRKCWNILLLFVNNFQQNVFENSQCKNEFDSIISLRLNLLLE